MAYSEAAKRATKKYIKNNLDEIRFYVEKGKKDFYKNEVEALGYSSLTQFIILAIDEKLEREKPET